MPPLNVLHNSQEEIPAEYQSLYTEKDGKWHLTGIAGVKTQADIDRLTRSLEAERSDHKDTKEKLRTWDSLGTHEDVTKKLDRMAELEIAAEGKTEEIEEKVEKLVEARVASRLAPVERENANLKKTLDERETEVGTLRSERNQRTVHDFVRGAARDAKVLQEAHDDMLLLAETVFTVDEEGNVVTKENTRGITPGLSPDLWLQEMEQKRPLWWASSEGGGAKGSAGGKHFSNNPWTADNWNITKQGAVVSEFGEEKAAQMARAAGSALGAIRPPVKK